MKKYRIRSIPKEKECVLWDGNNIEDIVKFTGKSENELRRHPAGDHILLIETLEGTMSVTPGNYIIKGIRGEFYPCESSILKESYKFIDEGPHE